MAKLLLLILGLFIGLTALEATVDAQGFMDQGTGLHQGQGRQGTGNGLLLGPGETYLAPIRPNAYGPGINSDATGRPFQWQPQGLPPTGPDPTLKVKPNAYGLGVHADQYGRIVEPVCPFGQSGC